MHVVTSPSQCPGRPGMPPGSTRLCLRAADSKLRMRGGGNQKVGVGEGEAGGEKDIGAAVVGPVAADAMGDSDEGGSGEQSADYEMSGVDKAQAGGCPTEVINVTENSSQANSRWAARKTAKRLAVSSIAVKGAVKRAYMLAQDQDGTPGDGGSLAGRAGAARVRVLHSRMTGELQFRDKDDELRVPDHVESIKEALAAAMDGQTVYARAGEHRWRGEMLMPRNKTIFVRGELGSRLWGQWARRHLESRAGVDNYCVNLPLGSQGSLGCLVLAHQTLGSFDSCVMVGGGPWIFGRCKVLSSHATALRTCGQADVLVRRCSLGGLEPAECVDEQVFGNNLARYALYAVGNSSVTLQASVLEHTGRAGGIGARVAGAARASLVGCRLRCNDIALSLDDCAHVEVTGSTVERNAWSAWHVGYKCFTCRLLLSDNTVIGRQWFNIRRPSCRIPRYQRCCNGRGCTKCYFSIDSMIPTRQIIERARTMNARPADREEDDMKYEEEEVRYEEDEEDGNHTRFIITYNQDTDEVELEHEVFREEDREAAMEIPANITGPAFLWRMNKPGPPNETLLGTEGLSAVAKWWDRMNSAYI